jgi:hypothetical protein
MKTAIYGSFSLSPAFGRDADSPHERPPLALQHHKQGGTNHMKKILLVLCAVMMVALLVGSKIRQLLE